MSAQTANGAPRDYTSGAHSQIRLYDDHLAIWNAGSLPPSLTPEMLFKDHDSVPRNRMIADAFFYMGLIERWGSGTTRIASELKTEGFPKPQFESTAGRFKVMFFKRPITEQPSAAQPLKNDDLSARQLLAVEYVKTHGGISNMEYQTLTGVARRTAVRDLNELKLKNILVSEGEAGRWIIYRLNPS